MISRIIGTTNGRTYQVAWVLCATPSTSASLRPMIAPSHFGDRHLTISNGCGRTIMKAGNWLRANWIYIAIPLVIVIALIAFALSQRGPEGVYDI